MKLSEVPDATPALAADQPKRQKLSEVGAEPTGEKPSIWQSLLKGGLHGLGDVIHAGAQIGARMGPEIGDVSTTPEQSQGLVRRVDTAAQQREQQYQADPAVRRDTGHPWAALTGRVLGNVAPAAALGAIPGAGATTGAGRIAAGAALGAGGAAMTPVTGGGDYWGEKLKQLGLGAGVGAAIPGVAGALAPRLPDPTLVARGISRAFRPLYNFFTGAEERTIAGFNRTVARQVLDPVRAADSVTRNLSGEKLVDHTEAAIDAAYERLKPQIVLSRDAAEKTSVETDQLVTQLSADDMRRFHQIVEDSGLFRKVPEWQRHPDGSVTRGVGDGGAYKDAQSYLTYTAHKFLKKNDDDLGGALLSRIADLNRAVVETNPAIAPQLKAADDSWKLFVRMRQAAGGVTAEGEFTPADLLRALKTQDVSAGKGAFAKGDLPLKGYANAAQAALGDRKVDLMQLMHIFTSHGLPMEVARSLVQPTGRGLKAIAPVASPVAGEEAAQARRSYVRPLEGGIPSAQPLH